VSTADVSIVPMGVARTTPYLVEIKRRLEAQDSVRYRMHAMGTSLEGSTRDILRVVGELHAVPLEMDAPRVYTVLKLDERGDRPDQTLDDKMALLG
jgi:uncharacterized protein (TIGR00106 family)